MSRMSMERGATTAWLIGIGLVLAACASDPERDSVARGLAFVVDNCARCHSVGVDGESPVAEAPPFRTLEARYPLEALEEALAEGIVTGHADMPQFALEPDQIADVLGYLRSLPSTAQQGE